MFDPSSIRVTGPLACHEQGLWADLLAQGYTPLSSRNVVRLMAHLSRWLEEKKLDPADLSEERIGEFLEHRREAGYTAFLTPRGVGPILEHLRRAGALAVWEVPVAEPTPLDRLLHGYERYLVQERALVPATVQKGLELGPRRQHQGAHALRPIHLVC